MDQRIRVGMPVILNRFDRPTSRLIAVVCKKEPGFVSARYLSANISGDISYPVGDEVTPLEDFGVKIIKIDDWRYMVVRSGMSRATYGDGSVREWQQELGEENQPYNLAVLNVMLSTL